MSAPLFRDPIFDGASDPVIVWDRVNDRWLMLYTQRRATVDEPGVAWVHGSRIGRAVSSDGVTWDYDGVVDGLDDGPGPNTHWAPELIDDGVRYRLYLTWIAGIPESWAGHPRHIVHFVSEDLSRWERVGEIALSSDRVIDACVARVGDGRFGLWFKDEAAHSTTGVAFSSDLTTWSPGGTAVSGEPHEGPNVFELGGWFWMIVDAWHGQRVLRSRDGLDWSEAGMILDTPGVHPDDRQVGRHADVVVTGSDEAVVFYFTHPQWDGSELSDAAGTAARRTAIHCARLTVVDGALMCDRDAASCPLPLVPTRTD